MPASSPSLSRRTLLFVLACLAPAATLADTPPRDGAAGVVARFDAAVAQGFPARVELPSAPRTRQRRAADDGIVVEGRLLVSVTLPDGSVGTMYQGSFDGDPAAFTRVGDHLGVSLSGHGDVRVVAFRDGDDEVTRRVFPDRQDDERELPRGVETIANDHIEDPRAYEPTFHVFFHDDLRRENLVLLHGRFVAWWMLDLARVWPGTRTHLVYLARVPWITDMDYEKADVLVRFHQALSALADAGKLPTYGRSYKHKFLLLTARPAVGGASGLAVEGQSEATASIAGSNAIVAHEFGHTLGATHERAQTNGVDAHAPGLMPWRGCDTNMHATAVSPYSCRRYSDANEKALRHYLRRGPMPDDPGVWLDR